MIFRSNIIVSLLKSLVFSAFKQKFANLVWIFLPG